MGFNRALSQVNAASNSNVTFLLAADLAAAGTVAVSYPPGKGRGNYSLGVMHQVNWSAGNVGIFPRDFELTFNATNITLTWRAATTIPAGSRVVLGLSEPGGVAKYRDPITGDLSGAITAGPGLAIVQLGNPLTATTTGILNVSVPGNRASSGAYSMTANAGALNIGGVAALNLDCPGGRNVQVVSSNVGDTTQTITVIGTDCFGQDMREARTANGTTPVVYVKAFARVTGVTASAVLAGNLSVGTGTVLGIPMYVAAAGQIIREMLDGAVASAGTFVAGAAVTPTATSADVRGTYVPNSAPDGSRSFILGIMTGDPGYIGGPQFNG